MTYAAVGEALTAWELFEEQLGYLFVAFITNERSYEAMRGFGAIMGSMNKLDMLEAAAKAFFLLRVDEQRQDMKERLADIEVDWGTLLIAVRGFTARRNEVAHGIVTLWDTSPPEAAIDLRKRLDLFLRPSFYATKKRDLLPALKTGLLAMPAKYSYSSREIVAFAVHFRDLKTPASRLVHAIRRHRLLEQQALLQKQDAPPAAPWSHASPPKSPLKRVRQRKSSGK